MLVSECFLLHFARSFDALYQMFFPHILGQSRLLRPGIFDIRVRAFLTYLSKHWFQLSCCLLLAEIHPLSLRPSPSRLGHKPVVRASQLEPICMFEDLEIGSVIDGKTD